MIELVIARYLPVWSSFFAVPNLVFLLLFYRSWKRHGGDQSCEPPLPKLQK